MGTEKTWQDFKTLEEFAEYMRWQLTQLMYSAYNANAEEAGDKAARLTTLCHTVATQNAMAQEVEDPQRYTLSALSVDLRQVGWRTPPSHPETDEDEDGEDPYKDA
jgi:hypothetical protein